MSENNNLKSETRNLFHSSSSMEITKENLWEDDCADRKEFAERFATIIKNIGAGSSTVILLNGEWGTGKTYFLKSFRQELENRKYKAIYLDAFAEDFSSDPLLAICGQLSIKLGIGDDKVRKTLHGIMACGKGALSYSGLNINALEETLEAIKNPSNILREYAESRKNLEAFKKDLSSIVAKNQNQEKKDGEVKPLVFIIDELDRCRPTFALELLERVKHLFDIPGIIFIFGANKNPLIKSMRLDYGNQESEYLQKFFDWELILPDIAYPSKLIRRYVDKLNYKVLMDDFGSGEFRDITDTLITHDLYYRLMDIMGVSFRQAQRSVQLLLLSLLVSESSRKAKWWYKIAAIACLTLLKVRYPNLYEDIAHKRITCGWIIEKMSPVFEKSTYPDANKVKRCQLFFNRTIYFLAEGEEKREIEKSKFPPSEYIDKESWGVIQKHLLDRAEVVAMLENLDCDKKTHPAY